VRVALPGVLVLSGPKHAGLPVDGGYEHRFAAFCEWIRSQSGVDGFPLVVLVDDAGFAAASPANFLWVTFTRSNPAADVLGAGAFTRRKHWGCRGPLVIDARMKPHMAPPLVDDPAVSKRVDDYCVRGGPLHGILS
jgi:4-hydroxy-3-polyprenylbenzoate decarboxylase